MCPVSNNLFALIKAAALTAPRPVAPALPRRRANLLPQRRRQSGSRHKRAFERCALARFLGGVEEHLEKIRRADITHGRKARDGFDLLFRGLELVTGGQRLHVHADYLAVLAERGLDPTPFAGYLEAFKHGMPPHGGFAMGLERWVARLVGAANVRETTLFPRDMQRLTP